MIRRYKLRRIIVAHSSPALKPGISAFRLKGELEFSTQYVGIDPFYTLEAVQHIINFPLKILNDGHADTGRKPISIYF
jgi:hypothetical protein